MQPRHIALAVLVAAIWGFLLGRYSPSVVAPFSLLVPLFGLLSGALVLGERLTANDLAAAALILAGLACATGVRKPVPT